MARTDIALTESAPTGRDFPLAFLILAHDNWPHLERLVARLAADPDDTVVIHIDGRVPNVVFDRVRRRIGRANVRFCARVQCHWGHYSLVEAALIAMDSLAGSGRGYRYASLISGVDYPIKPIAAFRKFLARSQGQEFIEAYNMYFERWVHSGPYTERFEYTYPFPRFAYHRHLFRMWERFQAKRDIRRSMPRGFVPFSGSQWWTLTREGVDAVLAAVRDDALVRFYRKTLVPDEMMMQTILMNSERRSDVAHRNLRHIVWVGSGTPHTFIEADFEELAKADGFLARKITVSGSSALVRRIDAYLL
jgi:hypothetical protein